MRFFGQEFGHGFFLRGDVGYSAIFIESETIDDDLYGVGILLGGGYGKQIAQWVRILLNVNYSMKIIESENYNALNFTVSGLF